VATGDGRSAQAGRDADAPFDGGVLDQLALMDLDEGFTDDAVNPTEPALSAGSDD
jgi:hypothetical protein